MRSTRFGSLRRFKQRFQDFCAEGSCTSPENATQKAHEHAPQAPHARAAWRQHSPLRVRQPLIRKTLLHMWRAALRTGVNPVQAWALIVSSAERRALYQQARGKGGFVRVEWKEALELAAAALTHTIRRHGPDRIFGCTSAPAAAMTGFAAGARFFNLIGAALISTGDRQGGNAAALPQVYGEQADASESADWGNAACILAWGCDLPRTHATHARFFTEARYRGAKITAITPEYTACAKFADRWLPVRAGTDGALALALAHVVLKEYFVERTHPYFEHYARHFTDLPCLVLLDALPSATPESPALFTPGRFLRAADLGRGGNNPAWKTTVFDALRGAPAVPLGSIGFRHGEEGRWSLHMRDCDDGLDLAPELTLEHADDVQWQPVLLPAFHTGRPDARHCMTPSIVVQTGQGPRHVVTVFDLLAAHLGVERGHGGNAARGAHNAVCATPAWQEAITGVPRADVIRVAREFADAAIATKGRALIIMGPGVSNWYHNDATGRCMALLTTLCGCQGVNGGGLAHFGGQEEPRPLAGLNAIAMAADWLEAPRLHDSASFHYFATDAWRYESLNVHNLCPPPLCSTLPPHPADCNALAVRLGWTPFYPQFRENPLHVCRKAEAAGLRRSQDIIDHVAQRLASGSLRMAVDEPSHAANVPRVMVVWRSNPLGAGTPGHEYFLRHMLGVESAVRGEAPPAPEAQGKLDLLVAADARLTTTALYADMVLPLSPPQEDYELACAATHPFILPTTPAGPSAPEARGAWDMFRDLAEALARLAPRHLGTRRDLVATPLRHDTPEELAQAHGQALDWRTGAAAALPGVTMPALHVVERRYADVFRMYTALGPRIRGAQGVGAKGVTWCGAPEHDALRQSLGHASEAGCAWGMPSLATARQACEAILALSPESNSAVAARAWAALEKLSGLRLTDMATPAAAPADRDFTAPLHTGASPCRSGMGNAQLPYAAFALHTRRRVPFRTLSGRQHCYLDHTWIRAMGEHLPVFRPALALARIRGTHDSMPRENADLVLNLLASDGKWNAHALFTDTPFLHTLSRGGNELWISTDDAASAGIADNQWLECFNTHGVFMGRAVVSPRIPRGKALLRPAPERHIHMPFAPLSGLRGGIQGSLARPLLKPARMIGGYAQLSYGFFYHGPVDCPCDTHIAIRRAGEVRFHDR